MVRIFFGLVMSFLFALRSIGWINCYLEWRNRELGYTNPKEALKAFLAK
jgi:hypothetical protein